MSPRAILAWSWTLVIVCLCWIPGSILPEKKTEDVPFLLAHLDKLVHLGTFVVWSFLWMRIAQPPHAGRRVFLWGVALAVLSELGQLMPMVQRDAGLDDGVADVLGVAVGILSFYTARRFLGESVAEPVV